LKSWGCASGMRLLREKFGECEKLVDTVPFQSSSTTQPISKNQCLQSNNFHCFTNSNNNNNNNDSNNNNNNNRTTSTVSSLPQSVKTSKKLLISLSCGLPNRGSTAPSVTQSRTRFWCCSHKSTKQRPLSLWIRGCLTCAIGLARGLVNRPLNQVLNQVLNPAERPRKTVPSMLLDFTKYMC
jgi:hypothetical protein